MTHLDAAAPTPALPGAGTQDTIRLTGLSAHGYHGVYDSECAEGQIFIADLVLRLGKAGMARAAASDSLADAVDYSAVASAVVDVLEGEPVALLETLASRIADVALGFAGVREVEVTVHKPQAPLEVAFDDVAVTITRTLTQSVAGSGQVPAAAVSGEPGSFTSIFGQVSRSDAAAGLRPEPHSHTGEAGEERPHEGGLLAGAASAAAAAGLGGVLAAGAGAAAGEGAAVAGVADAAEPDPRDPEPEPEPEPVEPELVPSEPLDPEVAASGSTAPEAGEPELVEDGTADSTDTNDLAGPADLADPAELATALSPLDRQPERAASAVIALGGNVGGVVSALRTAIHRLSTAEGVRVTDVAPLARTAPVLPEGAEPQPDYLNTVVLVETTLSPRELLGVCHDLEQEAGRVRVVPKGPRTLDADLIVYEGVTSQEEELILPHPRARERAFVLVPWAQANPFAEIGEESVAALAESAPDREGLRWLALDWLDSDHLPALPTGQYVAPPLPPEPAQEDAAPAEAPDGAPALEEVPEAAAVAEVAAAGGDGEPDGTGDSPVAPGTAGAETAAAEPGAEQMEQASDEPLAELEPALQPDLAAQDAPANPGTQGEAGPEPAAEPELARGTASDGDPAAEPAGGEPDAVEAEPGQGTEEPHAADDPDRADASGSAGPAVPAPSPAPEAAEQEEASDGVGHDQGAQDRERPSLALPEADDREWAAPPSWGDVMGGPGAIGATGPDGAAGSDRTDASGR